MIDGNLIVTDVGNVNVADPVFVPLLFGILQSDDVVDYHFVQMIEVSVAVCTNYYQSLFTRCHRTRCHTRSEGQCCTVTAVEHPGIESGCPPLASD
jgi:hypothetical protein